MDSEQILRNRLKGGGAANRHKQNYLGPIKYEGEDIAQFHNPKLFMDDILGENETKQFTSILIIGSPGTGKTTLATFIAHEAHEFNNYYVVHLGRKELLNFEKVMDGLPNQDIILIFDDVSLVFKHIKDPAKRTEILQTLTEARHPKLVKKDRKVMVIANIHYVNSIEKMWRSQGGWKIYTDMSNEEIQNFNYMTKSRFKHQIDIFAKITQDQFRRKKFKVSLTNKKTKEYTINKPFRFIMVYDNFKPRFFLVPNKSCNICNAEGKGIAKYKAAPRDIVKLSTKYYGKSGKQGLKDALLILGQTAQFPNKEVYALETAKEILSVFEVDLEELSLYLREEARIKGTRLYTVKKKKVNYIKDLEEIQKNEGNVTFGSAALESEKKGIFEDEVDNDQILNDEVEELDETTKKEMETAFSELDNGIESNEAKETL